MFFLVDDPTHRGVVATFVIWRDGFEWGRLVDMTTHEVISMQIAGLQVRVRPAPDHLNVSPSPL